MQKQVSISYTPTIDEIKTTVVVAYTLQHDGKTLTVSCNVKSVAPSDSGWLQIRAFSLRALQTRGGKYDLMFEEYAEVNNHDTMAFTELTFEHIMKQEKLKTTSSLANAA